MTQIKKTVTYWWIDDSLNNKNNVANLTKRSFEINKYAVNIETRQLQTWENLIQDLLGNQNKFDGLILDWKLSDEVFDIAKNTRASFDAEALAQTCRTLMVRPLRGGENKAPAFNKSFPIVLCSAQDDIRTIFTQDNSAADLFDRIYTKSEILHESDALVSLAEGYKSITAWKNNAIDLQTMLNLSSEQLDDLRESLKHAMEQHRGKAVHDIARFMLNDVIQRKGVLINEFILAARLGVDKDSSEGWQELKQVLSAKCQYKGVFCHVMECWWADFLENWWIEELGGDDLQDMCAVERVALLTQKGFKDLKAATIPVKGTSSEFWTACFGSGQPLAIVDGYCLEIPAQYTWQEPEYLCFDEAYNETHKADKWQAHHLYQTDKERLIRLYKQDS